MDAMQLQTLLTWFAVGLIGPHLLMAGVLVWGFYYRMGAATRKARQRIRKAGV